MNAFSSIAALLMSILLAGTAVAKSSDVTDPNAPRSLPAEGRISVRWEDPAQFSELRDSHNRSEARRGNWVVQLAAHLRKRAEEKLPAGERLEVNITDIRRAGNYEPWRGIDFNTVRFMREIYWPRMTLTFTRTDANGQVIAQGDRVLSDPSYLSGSSSAGSGDPLRYEKAMIDRWLQRELNSSASEAPRTP